MADLLLETSQIAKQEQYKDLLRQAEQWRLIKLVSQPESHPPRESRESLRRVLDGLIRRLPNIWPIDHAST